MAKTPRPLYELSEEQERLLALALITKHRFASSKLGKSINPESLSDPVAKHVFEWYTQAKLAVGDSVIGPTSLLSIGQKLVYEGKVLQKDVDAVASLFSATLPHDWHSAKQVIAAQVQAVEQRIAKISLFGAKDAAELDVATEKLIETKGLAEDEGSTEVVLPNQIQASVITDLLADLNRDKLPTGILELDAMLGGGSDRGGLAMFLAGTGIGKSMFLCSVAAEAILAGKDVLYVTMELEASEVQIRILCNITGLTREQVAANPSEAVSRYNMYSGKGSLTVKRYPAYHLDAPTLAKEIQKMPKPRPSVLLVDYADLMCIKDGTKPEYHQLENIYVKLRDVAIEENLWAWTVSQAKNTSRKNKSLDVDDTFGGSGKVFTADLVVTATRLQEDKEAKVIRLRVQKRRSGDADGREIGPLNTDMERYRLVEVNRREPWRKLAGVQDFVKK